MKAVNDIRVLSMRQPWAWLVAAGYKTIETRTWRTNYRGPLLIHACGKWNAKNVEIFTRITHPGVLNSKEIEHLESVVIKKNSLMRYTSGIIGMASLKDEAHTYFDPSSTCNLRSLYKRRHLCVPVDCYSWIGVKGWWLENAKLFDTPISCKGTLRLWIPPEPVIEKAMKQMR